MEDYRFVFAFVFFDDIYFPFGGFLVGSANGILVTAVPQAQSALCFPISLYGCTLDWVGHIDSHIPVENEVENVFLA